MDQSAQSPTPLTRRSAPRRTLAGLAAATMALTGLVSAGTLAGPTPEAAAAAKVPNVKALAGDLAKQKLVWEECDYGDREVNARFASDNILCTTVKVPRDWHNPANGKTWDIRISHAKNLDVKNARYKGTIFVNPGGPGGSGLAWGAAMQERTPDLNPYYNYVGFDPRGVGQSSEAYCPYEWNETLTPAQETELAARACSQNEDVKTINTEQTAYDMDFIRTLLAAPKLSYIGYSYGTWLGAWYQKAFGAKYADKFVLDSATDVTEPTLQRTWDLQPVARDRQFQRHLIPWIARHDADYGLGTDPAKIYERYLEGARKRGEGWAGMVWMFSGGAGAFSQNSLYPDAARVVQYVSSYADDPEPGKAAAKESPAASAARAADTLNVLAGKASTTQGEAAFKEGAKQLKTLSSTLKADAQSKRSSGQVAPKGNVVASDAPVDPEEPGENEPLMQTISDPFAYVRCNDGQWTQGENYWKARNAEMAKKYPLSRSWGMFGSPECAHWKTKNLMPVADSTFPNTIVVQGELDSQTAWETGYTTGTELPNTSFIAIDNEGSHGHFPYGTEAVDRPIYNYFLKGTMPKDIKVSQALPLPFETTTFESWKKLGANAKHKGALVTDPTTPAAGSKMTAAAQQNAKDDALLSKADTQKLAERFVAQNYGQRAADAVAEAAQK